MNLIVLKINNLLIIIVIVTADLDLFYGHKIGKCDHEYSNFEISEITCKMYCFDADPKPWHDTASLNYCDGLITWQNKAFYQFVKSILTSINPDQ